MLRPNYTSNHYTALAKVETDCQTGHKAKKIFLLPEKNDKKSFMVSD